MDPAFEDELEEALREGDAGMWFIAMIALGLPLGIGIGIGVLIMVAFG